MIFFSIQTSKKNFLMLLKTINIGKCVVIRLSTISNVFSSETTWPIIAKFYMEPPWEGEMKGYINGPGHMTKMAAMPIYGKNLQKSSSPEPDVL